MSKFIESVHTPQNLCLPACVGGSDCTGFVLLASISKNKLVRSRAFSKRLVILHPFITCYLSAIHMSRWLWHCLINKAYRLDSVKCSTRFINCESVGVEDAYQARTELNSPFHCTEHFEANMIVTVYGCLIALLFRYWWVCRWLCRVWQ